MNTVLWIVTILLVLAFLAAGSLKLSQPRATLQANMPWVADVTDGQVKAIGAVEGLGALGLVLPAVTGIAPVLVPLAATGLAITMAFAVATHVRRGEPAAASAPAVVLGLLAAFVAIGRFALSPL